MGLPPRRSRPGHRLVFCRYFRHWRTGKLVYPKRSKYFRFWVKTR